MTKLLCRKCKKDISHYKEIWGDEFSDHVDWYCKECFKEYENKYLKDAMEIEK